MKSETFFYKRSNTWELFYLNVLVYMIDIVRGEKIEVIDCLSIVKSMAKIVYYIM